MSITAPLQSRTVLIVEDESLILMLAEEILAEAGFDVLTANRSSEAVQIVHDSSIDCALLDVNLGNGDTSYPVAEQLRKRSIPFIFVSGLGTNSLASAFANQRVLQKPYKSCDLLIAIETCLTEV